MRPLAWLAAKRSLNAPRASCLGMASIDPRAPRFNQGVVGVGAVAAFVLDAPLVLPVLAALLAAGALLGPQASPLAQLWRRVLVPALRLGPPRARKDAAPVRFAQGVGFAFLAAASILLLAFGAGAATLALVGWGLVLAVAALALLAAVTDICAGCEMYVLLKRWTARPARS